jgi:hypothetical protein
VASPSAVASPHLGEEEEEEAQRVGVVGEGGAPPSTPHASLLAEKLAVLLGVGVVEGVLVGGGVLLLAFHQQQ